MDAVIVKLVQIGKAVKEFEISDNPTVEGLLKKAEVAYTPGTITVNHETVESRTELDDGDIVYIGSAMKGNAPFTVKLITLGSSQPVPEIGVEPGMTVKQVIDSLPPAEAAKFYNADRSEVYEYRINGEPVQSGSVIPTPSDPSVAVRIIMGTRTKGNAVKNPITKTTKKIVKKAVKKAVKKVSK